MSNFYALSVGYGQRSVELLRKRTPACARIFYQRLAVGSWHGQKIQIISIAHQGVAFQQQTFKKAKECASLNCLPRFARVYVKPSYMQGENYDQTLAGDTAGEAASNFKQRVFPCPKSDTPGTNALYAPLLRL